MPKSWLDSSRTGRGWLLGCLPRRSPGARTGFKLIIAFSDCWTIGRLGRLIGQLVYCHYYSAAQLAARPGPRPSADGAVISRLPPLATVRLAPAGHCLPLRLAQAPPGIPGRTQCADRGWPEAPSLQVPRGRARYSKRRRGRNAGVQTNWPWQWDGPQRLISPGRGPILRETRVQGFPNLDAVQLSGWAATVSARVTTLQCFSARQWSLLWRGTAGGPMLRTVRSATPRSGVDPAFGSFSCDVSLPGG